MGKYATLWDASVECPSCGLMAENSWQFRYGNLDFPDYQMGDEISWDGWNHYTIAKRAYAVAYPGGPSACIHCGKKNFLALIEIVDNRITGIEFYKDEAWVRESVLDENKQERDW